MAKKKKKPTFMEVARLLIDIGFLIVAVLALIKG